MDAVFFQLLRDGFARLYVEGFAGFACHHGEGSTVSVYFGTEAFEVNAILGPVVILG